jgi:hypothetical protein
MTANGHARSLEIVVEIGEESHFYTLGCEKSPLVKTTGWLTLPAPAPTMRAEDTSAMGFAVNRRPCG